MARASPNFVVTSEIEARIDSFKGDEPIVDLPSDFTADWAIADALLR